MSFFKKAPTQNPSLFARVFLTFLLVAVVAPPIAMPIVVYADPPPNPSSSSAQPATNPFDGCSIGGVVGSLVSFGTTTKGSPIATCLAGLIYVFFVMIPGGIAALAGHFFDYTLAMTIQSGVYNSVFLENGWKIARDVANMAFVFLLVYVAFTLILDLAHSGVGKQIAKILAVALLINFSFFFSRVVIDVSNLLSHQFYSNINTRPQPALPAGVGGVFVGSQQLQVRAVSEQVMAAVSIQQLFSQNSFASFIQNTQQTSSFQTFTILATLSIGFGVMTIIMIFVFLASGIKFIARILMLWLAIMLAPLGFVAWIIPGMGGVANKWWNMLIKNAFFAPAFAFLLFLIVALSVGTCGIGQTAGCQPGIMSGLTGNAFGAQPGAAMSFDVFLQGMVILILRLAIIAGLLMGALKIGDYFGQVSARTVVNTAKKYATTGWSGKGLGFAYSYTAGAGASLAADTIKGSRWANQPNSRLSRWIGYGAYKGAKGLAGTSIGGAESTLKRGERIKLEKQTMSTNLRDIENKEQVKNAVKLSARVEQLVKENKDNVAAGNLADVNKNLTPDEIKSHDQTKSVIKNFTKRELESLSAGELGALARMDMLTEDQHKNIQGSDKFTEKEKDEIKKAANLRKTETGQGSSDAPINQADKIVQRLRETQEQIPDDPTIAAQNSVLTRILAKDSLVTKQSIEEALKKIAEAISASQTEERVQRDKLRDAHRRGDDEQGVREATARIAELSNTVRNLRALDKDFTKLEEVRAKIPAGTTTVATKTEPATVVVEVAKAGQFYLAPQNNTLPDMRQSK